MAMNLFGTGTTGQFNELFTFSKIQAVDQNNRILWLQRQLELNGIFDTEYDPTTNYPVSFTCTPPNSYGAKLLQVYKILGGQPEKDMLLRTSDKPVYLTRSTNISNDPNDTSSGFSDKFSNGRRYRGEQRFDRDLGLMVQKLKAWQLEAIKRKRETLEFKIKRCLDYSDQLQNEITLLKNMLDPNKNLSVNNQIDSIEAAMFTTGRANVVDNDQDIFGLDVGRVADKMFTDGTPTDPNAERSDSR